MRKTQIGESWVGIILFLGFLTFILLVIFYAVTEGPARRVEAERVREAQRKPHVIREADGCKVYQFLVGDRFHYFTRCENGTTTTETTWEECKKVGKTTTCEQKSQSIETTNER